MAKSLPWMWVAMCVQIVVVPAWPITYTLLPTLAAALWSARCAGRILPAPTVGALPLLGLLLVAVSVSASVIVNPAHNGAWVLRTSLLILVPLTFMLTQACTNVLPVMFTTLRWALIVVAADNLCEAAVDFFRSGEWEAFTYHRFADGFIHRNAIYTSLFCATSLLADRWLGHRDRWNFTIVVRWLVLLLCASKLFVALTATLWLPHFLPSLHWRSYKPWLLTALMLSASVPVAWRTWLSTGVRADIFTAEKFSESHYFNGLELRLLLHRMGAENLKHHGLNWHGVGSYEANVELRQAMKDYQLYAGDGSAENLGYGHYNYHNQWMQQANCSGWLGGLGVLLFMMSTIAMVFVPATRALAWVLLPSAAFMLTESSLERTQGLWLTALLAAIAAVEGYKLQKAA